MTLLGRTLGLVSLSLALGCSLLIDASDIDAGCPSGQKLCTGFGCVQLDDPAFGCAPGTCIPCKVANAVAVCREERCEGDCLFGYGCADCHANLLTDEDNCGGCCVAGEPCAFSCKTGEYCRAGVCEAL